MSAPAWWSAADSAEQDVLVAELVRGAFDHRERCRACSPEPCATVSAWRRHLEDCAACRGDAPLTHGAPCERRAEFVAHGASCPRCNRCPSLRTAIEVVVDWLGFRELLSRAEHLRAERERMGAAA